MSYEKAYGLCDTCSKRTEIYRDGTNHILHVILSLLTCGLWLPIWLLQHCTRVGGWKCTQCGSKKVHKV